LIGEDMLFDTFGEPAAFLYNLRKFNIDITGIKHVILSHDDWDHIAGLRYLLNNRQDITVYICPGFKQEIKGRIISSGVKVIEAGKPTLIKNDIYSTGELYGGSEGRKIREQSVVIKTADGLAVICGCAHPGVANIVKQVKGIFKEDVYFLMGGFHLKSNTDEQNRGIIEQLRELGVRKIMPLHCTGKRASEIMREIFRSDYIRGKEGGTVEL